MIGGSENDALSIDTEGIRTWRAIVTLVVFVLTNVNVLCSFHITFRVPVAWYCGVGDLSAWLRISEPRNRRESSVGPSSLEQGSPTSNLSASESRQGQVSASPNGGSTPTTSAGGYLGSLHYEHVKVRFPMNFVTAPIIADLFLLAIGAIGGKEIRQGILGANNISPLDIMLFFITLAYIAISIDASGLIRFLAFKVLQWGGNNGRRLYLYLYVFFFGLTTFIGNDPVILSGTAFLAYMTRVSKDLSSPRAWIFSQFAAANIGSAILVSSNPTNLVLAGAFGIKFIHYTANMAVPTVTTAIVLYPILLYLVFTEPGLIPRRMAMYQLPSHLSNVPPANPNIPAAKDLTVTELSHCTPREAGQIASAQEGESSRDLLALEEVLNPFLDTKSAIVGSVIMATTLITLLALNAASTGTGEHPVFWVTLPAAFLMFCWDVGCGWESRHTTREIAKFGDKKRLQALAVQQTKPALTITTPSEPVGRQAPMNPSDEKESQPAVADGQLVTNPESIISTIHEATQCPARAKEQGACDPEIETPGNAPHFSHAEPSPASRDTFGSEDFKTDNMDTECHKRPQTLVGSCRELVDWLRATFPATMAVFSHLPLALIPFAFAMFVLVQALVSKHWVATFAYGWKHWVDKTGVVGGIGGMGFLSVVLCNFAGTNIGTTILLSRVIQTWEEIHRVSGSQIDSRTFWATVYSMAIGVNYGAFSAAFSASLAGLLWRDILARKEIEVTSLDFARFNLPIISVSMIVGLTVLIIQVYITPDGTVN